MAETRMAYIDWKKFDFDTVLENRKEYMICIPHDGEVVLEFAQYFDKGSVIDVKMADGKAPEGKEPTAEEQLLKVLFGASRPFTVPEDGFWVLTSDYGVDESECNGSFEGCREQAVCLGNRYGWDDIEGSIPVYWAERPLLPEGLSYDAKHKKSVLERETEAFEKTTADLDADPNLKTVYRSFCEDALPGDGPVEATINQAVYALVPYHVAVTVLEVAAMVRAMAKVPDEDLVQMRKSIAGMKKGESEAAMKLFDDFCDRNNLPRYFRTLLFHYTDYLMDNEDDFYTCRDRQLAAGGLRSLNLPGVMQHAWAQSVLPGCVGRLVKLLRIGVPDIIWINELRITVANVLAMRCGGRIVRVGTDFDAVYGVMPDGTRGKRHCKYGDKELQLMQEACEKDPSDDVGEVIDVTVDELAEMLGVDPPETEEEDEEANPVIGVDYPYFAVVAVPNFLMRKYRYALWDNTNTAYYRNEDGEVAGFTDWRDAKAKSEELGRIASAQADFAETEIRA